jgi:hypothetical protein
MQPMMLSHKCTSWWLIYPNNPVPPNQVELSAGLFIYLTAGIESAMSSFHVQILPCWLSCEMCHLNLPHPLPSSLFVWLVANGWCWFVLREKVLLTGLCWWLVAWQVDSLQATSVTISVEYNGAACIWNIVVMWCLLVLFRPVTEIAREVVFLRTPYRWYCWNVQY